MSSKKKKEYFTQKKRREKKKKSENSSERCEGQQEGKGHQKREFFLKSNYSRYSGISNHSKKQVQPKYSGDRSHNPKKL